MGDFPSFAGPLAWPLGYWNGLGALLAIGIVLLLWFAAESPGWRVRAMASTGLPIVIFALALTFSRGSAIAAIAGALLLLAFTANRPAIIGTATLATLGAMPALLLAGSSDALLNANHDAISGLVVAAVTGALLIGSLATGFVHLHLDRSFRSGNARWVRYGPALLVGAAVVGIAFSALQDPQKPGGESAQGPLAERFVAGSDGRIQLWGSAIDAFIEEPLKGVGAGGFETWWNGHGSDGVPSTMRIPCSLRYPRSWGSVASF